ncbi:peptidoglycan-binding protein [Patescibacteria group bacterium]|nr:peptidoglycan-binding protein [Patescibacteria group bacterium]
MSLFNLGIKKWPSKNQWRQFLKVLSKKEKVLFFIFLSLALSSFIFLSANFYFKNTEIKPALGGIFVEGILVLSETDFPRFINPIYAPLRDIDQDLTEILFSGLMQYNEKGGIVPDLANCQIQEAGKTYECNLKKNIFWHDGNKLTADDVIFTIKIIQDPEYNSPLRINWLGVEIEKISDLGIRFKLKNPYSPFLENLTLKILPKHIWENISAANFRLSDYNLKPIGSGPYQFKELEKNESGSITSLTLIANPDYFGKKPNISKISFKFFEKEEDLIWAFQEKEIQGFSILDPEYYKFLKENEFCNYSLSLPRYFALFFNPEKSKVLAEKEVREALNYGTNKKEILEKVLANQGEIVDSPILPTIYDFSPPIKIYQFDLEKAKEILDRADFKEKEIGKREKTIKKEAEFQFKSDLKLNSQGKEVEELQKCLAKDPEIYPEGKVTGFFGNLTKEAVIRFQEKYAKDILEPWGFKKGTGLVRKTTRAKLNEICFEKPVEILPLSFSLVTVDQSFLIEIANLLKEQWQVLGAEIEIKTFDISTLEREVIKPRDYESLLFGQVLGSIPDPFPFWHSLQKRNPGLNLALYENKAVDKLLEDGRKMQNFEERAKIYEEFQNILIADAPVVFLCNPNYLYFVSKEVKGIETKIIVDPSKRFSGIENWYIKTRRVWK